MTERHPAVDRAHRMRDTVDTRHADAELVTFVMDNPNTRGPRSFRVALEPAEARGPAERIGIVCAPKHGSRLNIAGTELKVLDRQRMSGSAGSAPIPRRHASAWNRDRNRSGGSVRRRLTTVRPRLKPRRPCLRMQGRRSTGA